jgi:hypothetical protein
MAKPIKETPILQGEDAERFLQIIASTKKVEKVEIEKMRASFKKLRNISVF